MDVKQTVHVQVKGEEILDALRLEMKNTVGLTDNHMVIPVAVRPPLKIMLFPVDRPGELNSADWVLSPHILKSFPHHFYTKEKQYFKEKMFAAARLAISIATC